MPGICVDAYCVAVSRASLGQQGQTLVLKLQSFHYEGECVRPSVGCFKQPDRVWMFRERSFKMSQYMASAYRVHEHSLVMN